MKIVAVCGMGIGTSVLLKMNIEKVLDAMGIDADVEAADIGTAAGAARMADIVLTSSELADEIGPVKAASGFGLGATAHGECKANQKSFHRARSCWVQTGETRQDCQSCEDRYSR